MPISENPVQPREQWCTGVETRMHVSARNGAAQLCMFEQWIAPDISARTHRHPVEEVLTVVAGEADMWIDDSHIVLTGGQSLVVPAHRIYAVLASSIFEATFDGDAVPMRLWAPPPTTKDEYRDD
jgi:mannose-6-phosphate isomerase-like protein (cupin superfamily)